MGRTRRDQTHCVRGHLFNERNTHWYLRRNGSSKRVCRVCTQMRDLFRQRLYGLSTEAYQEMLASQGGVCALCGGTPGARALGVDHDHATGRIRGLLCSPCNTGIGNLRDDPDLLRKAIAYLEAHRTP